MKIKWIVMLLLLASAVYGQSGITWGSSMDIAQSSFDNQHPRIVLDRQGLPMVIWGKLSSNGVYFSRMNSMGMFSAPVAVNSGIPVFTASWAGPDIGSFGDTVYVVMKETPELTNHMYISRSIDAGNTFSMPMQMEHFVDSGSRFPAVAVDSVGNPIVAYMNFDPGFTNAHYMVLKSNDLGNSFVNPVLASGYSGGRVCDCCPAAIINSNGITAVSYRDNLNDLRVIWSSISTDNGSTFPNAMNVDNTNWVINACPSTGPDAIIIGDSLYNVYMSSGTGTALCYITTASITNLSVGIFAPINNSIPGLTSQNYPRIANAGNKTAVVLKQTANGNTIVPLFYSNDITTNGLPSTYDTVAMGSIENADVVMTNSVIYIVWEDNNSGTVKFRKGLLPVVPLTVGGPKNNYSVNIYPNPAHNNLDIIASERLSNIKIFDTSGRLILSQFSINEKSLHYQFNLARGIYFLESTSTTNIHSRQKLIVE